MANFVFSAFADEAGTSLDEQIAALVENGIHYIEPRNIDGKSIIDFTDEELVAIREKLAAAGIKVGSVGSPIGKYPITDDFGSYLPKVKRTIEIAKILGTRYVRMFSFFVKQNELAQHREEVIARLKRMVELAEAEGVVLCHENESAIYGQMPKEVKDLLTSVPGLGGIFDAANYRMNGADTMEGIEATLINFKYMHIKDALEDGSVVPAGRGIGNLPYLLSRYQGSVLTIEPHLSVFDGLEQLENTEKTKMKFIYPSSHAAFDAAVDALKELI